RAVVTGDQSESFESLNCRLIKDAADPLDRKGLVQAEAEHHTLAHSHVARQRLELPGRPPACRQLGDVSRQTGRVPPAVASDCRNRANPEAEVVAAEPVREAV